MRVAYLAAGAGGMYCGSCLRDNRLAATLIAQGRDVVLVPLYTPLRTDEPDVSATPVYYGGINVYLQQHVGLFRQTPAIVDRLLNSRALLRSAGRMAGGTDPAGLGPLTISVLQGPAGAQRKELKKLVAGLKAIQPDLVNLPNLMFVGVAKAIKEALGVPVLCTLSGEDLFVDLLPETDRQQVIDLIRQGAANVDGFLAVTRYYADRACAHFGLDADRVHHAPLGISVDEAAPSVQWPNNVFTIGYLARVCPEKGLASLCEAFMRLRNAGRDCRLRIAGHMPAAHRAYLQAIRTSLDDQGYGLSVEFVGEVDKDGKRKFLESLHVLSVPTAYPEAKGLFALEAMAVGIPVVLPRHGSFTELVESTGGGLLYEPHTPKRLADTLAQLMDDETLRQRLAHAGHAAVRESFTDHVMASETWRIYERHCALGGG